MGGPTEGDQEVELLTRETESESGAERPDRIGPYKILDRLGEGGMGVVYLAEQTEPVRRRVALKLIKLGMDTRQVIARFEAERQALAVMNHPNVAKVFDAGATEQGRPYFVMEYVKGVPITEYCDLKCLPLRDRLELFEQVCEAIQHAHQKGIIHRDIKPSNVLVASEEGKPQLKVIDFGIAKATRQKLTEKTLFTQQGILIGTPEYMSPEQAGTTALDVDTRTDIYSLGVLLYELLVGVLPFDPGALRQAAAMEMLRIIREDDPPRPTTKLGRLGDTASEVAKRRTTDVRSLARQLKGELDWITMRALEKDPGQRYPSASELAADVRRHLEDEPVVAGPPSPWYRARKLVLRHRRVLLAWGVTVLLVLGVLTTGLLGYFRSRAADLESLAWVLEQAIATSKPLAKIDPEWPRLRSLLISRVEADPDGRFALLAHRAAAGLTAETVSFGLLSEPPDLFINFGTLRKPLVPQQVLWRAHVEVSWDGQQWKEIALGSWSNQNSMAKAMSLDAFLDEDALTEGPHILEVRARLLLFDPAIIPPAPEGVDVYVHRPEELSGIAPRFEERRTLGAFSVSLFSEYPMDFPREVGIDLSEHPPEKWLGVESIEIVRVDLPPSQRECFVFAWPGADSEPQTACLEHTAQGMENLIAGFRIEGHVHPADLPKSIATSAALSTEEGEPTGLRFELVLDKNREPSWWDHDILGTSWDVVMNYESGPDTGFRDEITRIRGTLRMRGSSEVLRFGGPGRHFRARLELHPSRWAALRTQRFETYLGDSFSIPVEVEVFDVKGRWTDDVPWDWEVGDPDPG